MFKGLKTMTNEQIEAEIKELEGFMAQTKKGRPSHGTIGKYQRLLFLYNEASERKWQATHGKKDKRRVGKLARTAVK